MGIKKLWRAFSRSLDAAAPVSPRSQARVPTQAVPVFVTWSFGGKATGVMCDTSGSGMGLRLNRKVPSSERVRIDLNGTAVHGRVRYCRRDPNGEYITGFIIE